jgi:hypothetical protein
MSYFSSYQESSPVSAGTKNDLSIFKSDTTQHGKMTIVIPRGEVVRNFFYSGALDLISQKMPLSLFSVALDDSIIGAMSGKFGTIEPLIEYDEKWLVRIQREILETAHNRWQWTAAARERARLRDSEAQTAKQKAFRAAKKIISYPLANRAGLYCLSKSERLSSRCLKPSDDYTAQLKKISPSLVFNGSHVHSRVATQLIQAAQWLKIPTATFIFSWDNLTSQGRISLPYEYFLVWNEALKKQLIEMYRWIKPENVFVTGTPQFDFHFRSELYQSRKDFCSEIGANPVRPIVLYTTGMANHMPQEPELVEEIADLLELLDEENRPQLLVRVYPKDLTGRFEELKKRRRDILFPQINWSKSWLTPLEEDSASLVNMLRHCALGINIASTVSLELCMFDKPVINIGYNPQNLSAKDIRFADYYEFEHYRPVVASGAVELARNPRQLRELIAEYLKRPERRRNERADLMKKMFGSTLDGKSAERVAQTLLDIAARR